MASPSPGQPSRPDPGSVLCDKCKNPVLEPVQSTEHVTLEERKSLAVKDWFSTPRMWPMGYILGSPYSPFRVEKELPKRNWRDAFEDLLALESGSDMISEESREQEKIAATSFGREWASDRIEKINKLNAFDVQLINSMRSVPPGTFMGVDKFVKMCEEGIHQRIELARGFETQEKNRGDFSTSQKKGRGQWMTSLITSGALTGWSSVLEDSNEGDSITFDKEGVSEKEQEEDRLVLTENTIGAHFEARQPLRLGPGSSVQYLITSLPNGLTHDRYPIHDSEFEMAPQLVSNLPDRPCFRSQTTTAERIILPNGRTATKVVMRNKLTNGDVEEKVLIQQPAKVLQEVEKARASIYDRMYGFDLPIPEFKETLESHLG